MTKKELIKKLEVYPDNAKIEFVFGKNFCDASITYANNLGELDDESKADTIIFDMYPIAMARSKEQFVGSFVD